jgi:hypothetical protein
MKINTSKNVGMERLIRQHKKKFETEENLNYYAYKDFIQAQRKYLKFVLDGSPGASASADQVN